MDGPTSFLNDMLQYPGLKYKLGITTAPELIHEISQLNQLKIDGKHWVL